MTRRQILALAGAAPTWLRTSFAASAADKYKMGGTPTAFSLHSSGGGRGGSVGGRAGAARFDVFEYCHTLGLGGAEVMGVPATDSDAVKAFRAKADSYGMYLVTNPSLPQDTSQVERFDAQVKVSKDLGAAMIHAAMTQRRYEEFATRTPADFKASFERNRNAVRLAEPVLRKYQMRLAIENHKGWRAAEHAAWLRRLGSEYVGVCLDFGNNISLCEDPMDTLNTLLPFIFYSHIKDMAVEEYEDGFLLSEVPMGEGFLDLKAMVAKLRQKDPNTIFGLEMITRDPLKVPVYTPGYWASFDDSYSPLPGRDLAKLLALVKKNKPKKPLPRVAGLPADQALKLEDEYNAQCIAYARQNLDM